MAAAHIVTNLKDAVGSCSASIAMASASASCIASIQPRRRPSTANGYRSTKGAHRNFSRYGSATYDIRPMVVLVAPESFNHACSALSVS